jgi:CheY-like chemotaxis protein
MNTLPPDSRSPRRLVLVAVPDLFFLTRIRAVADASGARMEECGPAELPERTRQLRPDLVIVDLHAPGDPLESVRALKRDAAVASIHVVGFYSHVDQELRARAEQAGVDAVLPRSAFTAKLPRLILGSA